MNDAAILIIKSLSPFSFAFLLHGCFVFRRFFENPGYQVSTILQKVIHPDTREKLKSSMPFFGHEQYRIEKSKTTGLSSHIWQSSNYLLRQILVYTHSRPIWRFRRFCANPASPSNPGKSGPHNGRFYQRHR